MLGELFTSSRKPECFRQFHENISWNWKRPPKATSGDRFFNTFDALSLSACHDSVLLSPRAKKKSERKRRNRRRGSFLVGGKVKSADCTVARVFTLFTATTCRVYQPRPMLPSIMLLANLPASPVDAEKGQRKRVYRAPALGANTFESAIVWRSYGKYPWRMNPSYLHREIGKISQSIDIETCFSFDCIKI